MRGLVEREDLPAARRVLDTGYRGVRKTQCERMKVLPQQLGGKCVQCSRVSDDENTTAIVRCELVEPRANASSHVGKILTVAGLVIARGGELRTALAGICRGDFRPRHAFPSTEIELAEASVEDERHGAPRKDRRRRRCGAREIARKGSIDRYVGERCGYGPCLRESVG